eukprot:3870386-Alexandrium_andersonii.AAC.1
MRAGQPAGQEIKYSDPSNTPPPRECDWPRRPGRCQVGCLPRQACTMGRTSCPLCKASSQPQGRLGLNFNTAFDASSQMWLGRTGQSGHEDRKPLKHRLLMQCMPELIGLNRGLSS